MTNKRTAIVIVGAGPSGLALALALRQANIESIVLEHRSRAHVLGRIRAGVLEDRTASVLRRLGVGERMDREGEAHKGVLLASQGRLIRIDFKELVDRCVIVYGQTKVQEDLYRACDERGVTIVHEVVDVRLADLESQRPVVTYRLHDEEHRIAADFVAGCDGSSGASRRSIPREQIAVHEKAFPFGWLGVLSRSPPVADELIYAQHERGFALCSMRNRSLSRYYIQCPSDESLDAWSDDQIWDELRRRIPSDAAQRLVTGPIVERSITPVRSFVAEPMSCGRLFLAGDAAHVVPPAGAKGLNLAIADVAQLGDAFSKYYHRGSMSELEQYSELALRRVWRAVRFSCWLTQLTHCFPQEDQFATRLRSAEVDDLVRSRASQMALALGYVGCE